MAVKLSNLKRKPLPDEPGVYFFKDARGNALYIGKAASLRDRVRSYFAGDIADARGSRIVRMLSLAEKVDVIATDSVLDALILEAQLIRKHQPPYNAREKDDKSFNHLVITKEEFPQVLIVRGRDLEKGKVLQKDIKYLFGPFPHGSQFKEAVKIVRRIFPFRDNKCIPLDQQKGKQGKPCFNRQIGLCPGVCTGEINKREYARTIRNLKLFFEGKKRMLLKTLEKEMRGHARKQEFELAAEKKRQIHALTHIRDVALLKREPKGLEENGRVMRIESYDIAHISGTNAVGVMTVLEDGEAKKSDYRKFRIKTAKAGNDVGALKEVLSRRLGHQEWPLPRLFVVDGGKAQKNAAERLLNEAGIAIPVVSVVKDERHRPREILGDKALRAQYEKEILQVNAEAHRFAITYHKKSRGRGFLQEGG